jgi:L-ascorbate metabolism protein UlaG (beta-lactamase superfamily)
MRLKWYGTATILLEHGETRLLFDPFFPLNDKCLTLPIDELATVSHILVSHGHIDHISTIPSIINHGGCKAFVYCTATPRKTLISKGVSENRIQVIKPFDVLNFGAFEVRVYKSKHIIFNMGIAVKTILNPRILRYRRNLKHILKENKICVEAGETVAFDIKLQDKQIFLLGSLNLDGAIEYPVGVDLLVLPFQGRSDICRYAMTFIERLMPKKLLLTHFDDSFPPISSAVNPEPFISLMRQQYPNIPVICSQAIIEWIEI